MTLSEIGNEIYQLIEDLYPICRSITGNGFRQSMHIIREYIPLELHEITSGTNVYDWVVPKEWNVRDAWIKNKEGKKIVDFQQSNLHLLNYSTPIHRKVPLDELREHLFSLPEHEDWIPYRTSYYQENWGFCLTHRQLQNMTDDEYEVMIDTSLENGHLTYGECLLKGEIDDEFLISCHSCHPSLCNDNLSGMALTTFLAKHICQMKTRYSYRFLFIPGTIGSITWLNMNEKSVYRIKNGLVLACLGDLGLFHYKKTKDGDTEIDHAVQNVLMHSNENFKMLEFSPYGYDERQYASPGFNLNIGSISRTPHGQFAEYHTSADNLDFINAESIANSYNICLKIIQVIDQNKKYINLNPKCEPQLGKRGLYSLMGGRKDANMYELAMLWVLNMSDGKNSLLDIAERSGMEFGIIHKAADDLLGVGLLSDSGCR